VLDPVRTIDQIPLLLFSLVTVQDGNDSNPFGEKMIPFLVSPWLTYRSDPEILFVLYPVTP